MTHLHIPQVKYYIRAFKNEELKSPRYLGTYQNPRMCFNSHILLP